MWDQNHKMSDEDKIFEMIEMGYYYLSDGNCIDYGELPSDPEEIHKIWKELCNYHYTPGTWSWTLADVLKDLPADISPKDVRIETVKEWCPHAEPWIEVHYNRPNENYDKEMRAFEWAMEDYVEAYQAWKDEGKQHKENSAQYKKDKKEYDKWLADKIKEIEMSAE
jgi:hypothetical protein